MDQGHEAETNGTVGTSPALEAMRVAMRQAEEAAAARQKAKQEGRRHELPEEDMEMLAELALIHEPVVPLDRPFESFAIDESAELETLIAQASAHVPDPSNEERDGDLVVVKHDTQATPWYQEAGEAALPAALRGITGPVDVKTLLTALMVEIGDVKRTNAILMELVTRVEEKVDRVNRQLKDRRFH